MLVLGKAQDFVLYIPRHSWVPSYVPQPFEEPFVQNTSTATDPARYQLHRDVVTKPKIPETDPPEKIHVVAPTTGMRKSRVNEPLIQ